MSNSRDYYSSRTSRRSDHDEYKQEGRLPSLRHVVGDPYDSRTTYDFHEVKCSLPPVSRTHHQSYSTFDEHTYPQRGPTLAPIHSGSSLGQGPYSSYSSSSHSSTHQYPAHAGHAPTSNSSRSNANYPSNDGHSFQAFYQRGSDLVAVSPSSTRPQGVVRTYDIPNESEDPRKKHKCPECGKGFDRPSGLETHMHRHSGDKPFPCPAPSCERTFSVKSNMARHYRKQHGEEEDVEQYDHNSNRHSTYSGTSRGSSEQSSSAAYYTSRRR